MTALSLAAVVVLALVHVFSEQLRLLDGVPRSRLLSIVGGMAVAFVVLRLLPALAEHQQALEQSMSAGPLSFLKNHVYVVVLASIALYYGLERLAKQSREENEEADRAAHWVFWIHIGTFALMNVLIGFLLLNHVEQDRGTRALLLFTLAMLFKFMVNDHGLHRDHKELYDQIGRWILVAAVLLGWGINYALEIPRIGPAILQAFLAGGVLLNVLKEELPPERKSRYWAFALGAGLYGALLVTF